MCLGVIGHVSDRRERAAGNFRRIDSEGLFRQAREVIAYTGDDDLRSTGVDVVLIGNRVVVASCQRSSVEGNGNFRLPFLASVAIGAGIIGDRSAGDLRLADGEGLCDLTSVVARAGDGNGIAARLSAGQVGNGIVRADGQGLAVNCDGHSLGQFIAGVGQFLIKGNVLGFDLARFDREGRFCGVDRALALAGCGNFVGACVERLRGGEHLMVVLVEELERDVACTCRFGLADAGGNSIAVGDGSRNVDLERIRVGVLVNDLDGERTGRLVIIRRREFQCSRVRRVISSICLIRISQHKRDRTHVIAW